MCGQLATTHSIEADIPDTAATFLHFDGITAAKASHTATLHTNHNTSHITFNQSHVTHHSSGAAVVKQLVARVGMTNFKTGVTCSAGLVFHTTLAGMQLYFQKHSFGNTTLAQFLECVACNVQV